MWISKVFASLVVEQTL